MAPNLCLVDTSKSMSNDRWVGQGTCQYKVIQSYLIEIYMYLIVFRAFYECIL